MESRAECSKLLPLATTSSQVAVTQVRARASPVLRTSSTVDDRLSDAATLNENKCFVEL